jgi:aminoglycoside 6'-N-acetyltransferase
MPEPLLGFEPLARTDFPMLVRWLAEPHVASWWGPPLDLTGVETEFGPCIDGTDPTVVFVVTEGGAPVGLLQIYRLADNRDYARAVGTDDAAGIDLLIGEPARCGAGLGPRMISQAAELIWERYPEVGGALAGPSVHNTRSHRAFEKAGFSALRRVTVPGEEDDEMIFYRPRPTGG